jgi:N-acetylglutamate synthase-like GNAT family acetyltransferase
VTPDLRIRRAEPADVPALHDLIQSAMAQYALRSGIPTLLDSQKETQADVLQHVVEDIVLVAESHGHLTGTARLTIQADRTAYFSRFAVSLQRQQSGIGKRLFAAAEAHLLNAGVTTVLLHTAINNKSLVSLYTARGFELISVANDRGYARGTFRKILVRESAAQQAPSGDSAKT